MRFSRSDDGLSGNRRRIAGSCIDGTDGRAVEETVRVGGEEVFAIELLDPQWTNIAFDRMRAVRLSNTRETANQKYPRTPR